VFSLAETLTKMMALDLDLHHVIAMATSNSARAIKRSHELGSIKIGRSADLSVLRLRTDGPFPVSDGVEVVDSPTALQPVGCVRSGAWYPTRDLPSYAGAGRTWGEMPDDIDW